MTRASSTTKAIGGASSTSPGRGCPGPEVLQRTDHYVVSFDWRCRLCVAQRTPAPFARTEDVEASFRAIERGIVDVPRSQCVLLVDIRFGPGRNDPSFEAAMAAHRGKLVSGFANHVVLAHSAAGRLQIRRLARRAGQAVLVTDDPEAAFAYLAVTPHQLPAAC